MEHTSGVINKKIFFLLWGLCIIGALSVLPFAQYSGILPSGGSILQIFFLSALQAALFFGLICWLSSKILPKTDLHPFVFKNPLKRVIYPAIISGISVGLVVFFFDKIFFGNSPLSGAHPPFWMGALASIYGAVNEEVLLRLFLFTLIYFILNKIFRVSAALLHKYHHRDRYHRGKSFQTYENMNFSLWYLSVVNIYATTPVSSDKKTFVLWTINILVALIFGLGHLPATFKLVSPSVLEIVRVIFLNGIAGVVLGWLYWSRGLWTAMAAHFIMDLMIHIVLI